LSPVSTMEEVVDITCPDDAVPGDTIHAEWQGHTFAVVVPVGARAGDTFQVHVPMVEVAPRSEHDSERQRLHRERAREARATLRAVLDRLDESRTFGCLIDDNCHRFANYEPGCEAMHEWYSCYETYMSECDAFIAGVLEELHTSAEAVFALAQRYRGRDERVQSMVERLQTAADFEGFCGMMRERYEVLQMLYGPSLKAPT